jgi:hypothetical protein
MIDNIACVISYLDDAGECPADYVLKWKHDYEAFVAAIDYDKGEIDSISIGRFATSNEAVRAIWTWNELERHGTRQ